MLRPERRIDWVRIMRNRRRFYRIKEHREAVKLRRLAAAIAAPIDMGGAADGPENPHHD